LKAGLAADDEWADAVGIDSVRCPSQVLKTAMASGDHRSSMDALFIAPAVALSFVAPLLLGKALLYALITLLQRAGRS
jgi:hypothetical protein